MPTSNSLGLHLCKCGRLYKDYTGTLHQCEKCLGKIQKEWEAQNKKDEMLNQSKEILG